MTAITPILRSAELTDAASIEALMKASISDLFPRFYDEQQTDSAVRHVGVVDRMLIADKTYFVADVSGEPVACGGWSRRDRLYTGSGDSPEDARLLDPRTQPARVRAMFVRSDWTRRGLGTLILQTCEDAARREGFRTLALVATLPGIPLYEHFGFRVQERLEITLPDGVKLPCAAMERPVAPAAPAGG